MQARMFVFRSTNRRRTYTVEGAADEGFPASRPRLTYDAGRASLSRGCLRPGTVMRLMVRSTDHYHWGWAVRSGIDEAQSFAISECGVRGGYCLLQITS